MSSGMQRANRTYYGVPIGILILDSKFQRFNGDIGNAQTWPFPVQYKVVRGAVPNKVVDTLNNRDLLQRFLDAADELIEFGAAAENERVLEIDVHQHVRADREDAGQRVQAAEDELPSTSDHAHRIAERPRARQ